MWRPTLVISTPKRLRQEECDSKASLDFILRPCLKTLKQISKSTRAFIQGEVTVSSNANKLCLKCVYNFQLGKNSLLIFQNWAI